MKAQDITAEQLNALTEAARPLMIALLAKTISQMDDLTNNQVLYSLLEDFLEINTAGEDEDPEVHRLMVSAFMALQMLLMTKSYLREGSRSVKGL